jgi:molybdopterin synthase catalytic subunit
MDLQPLIQRIKKHPEYNRVGMILCHQGVVRKTTREGRKVSGLRVRVDPQKLNTAVQEHKRLPGIVEILVEIDEGKDLAVGEDVMLLVVAGDIRENVIAALSKVLDRIKSEIDKIQFYD